MALYLDAVNKSSYIHKTDQEIEAAFKADGFKVSKKVTFEGQRGFIAESLTAINTVTKNPKRAYYVEGNSYQMGYLIGLMTPDETEEMATTFLTLILPETIPSHPLINFKWFWQGITFILSLLVRWLMTKDVPEALMQEMQGIEDGCRKANHSSKVNVRRLLTLNAGFDFILSFFYDPRSIFYKTGIKPESLSLPAFCNGFAAFGQATIDSKHYLGRDFMFATADIFQDVACMIIYNPIDSFTINNHTKKRLPILAMTAPGFVGCIAALNTQGIGLGVDVLPSASNNPRRPGLNSLMLVRYAADFSTSTEDATKIIVNAQRGVSWIYIAADANSGRAAVIEAGMKTNDLDPFQYPDPELFISGLLPNRKFFEEYGQKDTTGLWIRWNDYQYPNKFLDFNEGLFEHFGKQYTPDMMIEKGFINTSFGIGDCKGKGSDNNPSAYYFAPQRENKSDLVLATNMAITPSMRLCGMDSFVIKVVGDDLINDSQWRYDELNYQLLEAYGNIDANKAWELVDFLNPYRKFPNYYGCGKTKEQFKDLEVQGSTSLLNLTDKTMKSLYGYFGDEAVKLSLLPYL